MNKICFKCSISKPLYDFYPHSQMKDGHLNKCKECNKNDVKNQYKSNLLKDGWLNKERARGREKYNRLGYKDIYKPTAEKRKIIVAGYKERYPEKIKAKNLCQHIKLNKGIEKHHWSYNIEHCKDIIQLTKSEHMKAHRFLLYDRERFMYRRQDNNELLDSKEKHESYIIEMISTHGK